MSRCKACDHILAKKEIVWVEKRHSHEALCLRCRTIIHKQLNLDQCSEDEYIDLFPEEYPDYGNS